MVLPFSGFLFIYFVGREGWGIYKEKGQKKQKKQKTKSKKNKKKQKKNRKPPDLDWIGLGLVSSVS